MWSKTLVLLLALSGVSSFSTNAVTSRRTSVYLHESSADVVAGPETKVDMTASIVMPQSYSEMVRQVSSAMRDAFEQKIERQIVRVLLPRTTSSEELGVLSEGILDVDSQDIVLVPPDESWQGGIMQLYYSAAPTCKDALRLFTKTESGVSPRIEEDRSVDESGVDGVGLLKAELGDDKANVFIQPSQETIDDYVDEVVAQGGLTLLFNPQWRLTDDVFDKASKDDSFFGQVASFLGGKGNTLKRLDDMNFESVYNFEGYVCRGYNVRLVKRFDSDYVVFCENKSSYDRVGTKPVRPTYQEVDEMLTEKGYGYKYADNMGL
ncbi:expressed unknown protein [Seminavis robusta]|uniref:DUF1995 domain-containing protein n=1 Tax=Seminavis robusta TaxID=568900 RepID=A0A9N8EFR0_9STRA|nr:expressed unknown protein [Seminavis robusta]|eukprot:Sro1012_g231210.1 n/a (321) ;mRNA; r:25841-26918